MQLGNNYQKTEISKQAFIIMHHNVITISSSPTADSTDKLSDDDRGKEIIRIVLSI